MPYVVWTKKGNRLTRQHIVTDVESTRTFCGLSVPPQVRYLGPHEKISFIKVCKNCTRTAKAWVGANVEDSE